MQIRIKPQGNRLLPYYEMGEGDAVVLLHGFMESGAIWDDFARALASHHRVIVPDLPGHGSAPAPAESPVEMANIAEQVHKLLIHLKVQRCTLVGHSMGGYVALELVAQHHDLAKALVLFHSHAAADSEEAKANRDRAIHAVQQNHKGFVTQFIPDLFAPENRTALKQEIAKLQEQASHITRDTIVATMQGMKNRQCHLETLKNIQVPVLFILGQLDSRIPVSGILEQALLPPQATLLILKHCGHMGYLEQRTPCLNALRNIAES